MLKSLKCKHINKKFTMPVSQTLIVLLNVFSFFLPIKVVDFKFSEKFLNSKKKVL